MDLAGGKTKGRTPPKSSLRVERHMVLPVLLAVLTSMLVESHEKNSISQVWWRGDDAA